MRRIQILSAAMMVASCGTASPGCNSPDPKGIVGALQPREQFKAILTSVTKRTRTAAMASAKDGPQTQKKLAEAIEAAVDRHAAAWEQSLVNSWATLSRDELKQVCSALNDRDRSTFSTFAARVGPIAQARNELLLRKAGVEVLETVWGK